MLRLGATCHRFLQIVAHIGRDLWYTMWQTIQDFAFNASFWLPVECRKFKR